MQHFQFHTIALSIAFFSPSLPPSSFIVWWKGKGAILLCNFNRNKRSTAHSQSVSQPTAMHLFVEISKSTYGLVATMTHDCETIALYAHVQKANTHSTGNVEAPFVCSPFLFHIFQCGDRIWDRKLGNSIHIKIYCTSYGYPFEPIKT